MSDKLPMTREQIEEEMSRCFPECLSSNAKNRIAVFTEHILRIGTTDLREENKRLTLEVDALRNGEFICKKCGLRTDAEKSGEGMF